MVLEEGLQMAGLITLIIIEEKITTGKENRQKLKPKS